MLPDAAAHLDIVDRIYEAAFVPDEWPPVLKTLSGLSGSASGAVCVFSDASPVRGKAQENIRPLFDEFLAGDSWKLSGGIQRMYALRPTSFVPVEDSMTAVEIEQDPVRMNLRAFGIGQHACAAVPLPNGDLVTFVFQRWTRDGVYDRSSIHLLDGFRHHLARAALVAGRLGLDQARGTASALQAIGSPAAVLSRAGCVQATNGLFDAMTSTFRPTAFGGIAITDQTANDLLHRAIEAVAADVQLACSIPIPARDGHEPMIIHVLPLRRNAHDIFSGADVLVTAATVSVGNLVPPLSVLTGLFDLSPSEARLAVALTQGHSLKAFAEGAGITFGTARKYLDRIYLKTGTHRQSELVALLKGVQAPGEPA